MIDPWSVQQLDNDINAEVSKINGDIHETAIESSAALGFEDSFIAENNNFQQGEREDTNSSQSEHKPLPDSEAYLKGLERKLDKLKKNSKLVDALSEKRDDCLRSLVQNDLSDSVCNNELLLDLEASIVNSDSAVHNLFRQLQPVQPVTVGETVHIVNFDQLEEQRLELEAAESTGEEEELPAKRKLDKLKKNSKLVDALSEKRDDCLRSLVQNDLSDSVCNNELLLDLEASIVNSDSAVHNLFRQLQPVQPVTVGETVHIVNFDQLEEQRLELEAAESTGEEEELPASR